MRNVRWIIGLFLLVVVVFTGNVLRKPLRDSTAAFDQSIQLTSGKTIVFEAPYAYGYNVRIRNSGAAESVFETIGYVLSVDGKQQVIREQFSVGNGHTEIGTFFAEEGAACKLTFTTVGKQLRGKRILLIIDVTGGGPSVGNAWQKAYRPVLQTVFWAAISAGVCILPSFARGMRRKQRGGKTG